MLRYIFLNSTFGWDCTTGSYPIVKTHDRIEFDIKTTDRYKSPWERHLALMMNILTSWQQNKLTNPDQWKPIDILSNPECMFPMQRSSKVLSTISKCHRRSDITDRCLQMSSQDLINGTTCRIMRWHIDDKVRCETNGNENDSHMVVCH